MKNEIIEIDEVMFIIPEIIDIKTDTSKPINFIGWFLESLYFDSLNVQTEEELYKHYNLTQEEINWIEQ